VTWALDARHSRAAPARNESKKAAASLDAAAFLSKKEKTEKRREKK
jgi:hypothetical protein